MTSEQKAAYINGQAAIFNARVSGMNAENQQRVHRGDSLAYTECAYTNLEIEFSHLGYNEITQFFQE